MACSLPPSPSQRLAKIIGPVVTGSFRARARPRGQDTWRVPSRRKPPCREDPARTRLPGTMDDVEVYGGGVVHHAGVVLSRKDVPRAAHGGGKLVDLVERPVHHPAERGLVPEVPLDELVGGAGGMLVDLQVHPAHPEPLFLQAAGQMPPMNPPAPQTRALFTAGYPLCRIMPC